MVKKNMIQCKKTKKAQSTLISAVLYFLLIIVIVFFALQFGIRKIGDLREIARFNTMKQNFQSLEKAMLRVSSGGVSTRETVAVKVDEGIIEVQPEKNHIRYLLPSENEIISSGRTVQEGGLLLSNNAEVNAFHNENENTIILENEFLYLEMKSIGEEDAPELESIDEIIEEVKNKRLDVTLPAPKLNVMISGAESSNTGLMWSRPDPEAFNVGEGKLTISMTNVTAGDITLAYDVTIRLKTGCDFFIVDVENLVSEAVV